jgi:monoamine oxidase
MSDELPRVVVVGAGLAGLRCADRLAGRVDVVVLEARDRVGGRCWSSHGWDAGQVAEHGGELLEEGQDHVLALVTELGLQLEARSEGPRSVRLRMGGAIRDVNGITGLPGVVVRLADELDTLGPVDFRDPSPLCREIDEMTASDWIGSAVEGGRSSHLGQAMAMVARVNLGMAPENLSALALHHMWCGLPDLDDGETPFRFGHDAETSDEVTSESGLDVEFGFGDLGMASVIDVFHVAGGNDLIATALADRLPPGALRLSSPVTAIRRRPDGRYVVSVDGRPLTDAVEHVVITAPLPTLRGMDLSGAGLTPRRHRAIAEVPMGSGTKLTLQLDIPPGRHEAWPGLGLLDDPALVVWDASRGQPGEAGLLTLFTSTREFATALGAHGAPDAESLTRALAVVADLAPGLESRCTGVAWLDSWPDDQWARGSYAAFAPGQYAEFAGFLGTSDDGIHFAGEHTSLSSPGYLDGAVASGERAARDILASLRI